MSTTEKIKIDVISEVTNDAELWYFVRIDGHVKCAKRNEDEAIKIAESFVDFAEKGLLKKKTVKSWEI